MCTRSTYAIFFLYVHNAQKHFAVVVGTHTTGHTVGVCGGPILGGKIKRKQKFEFGDPVSRDPRPNLPISTNVYKDLFCNRQKNDERREREFEGVMFGEVSIFLNVVRKKDIFKEIKRAEGNSVCVCVENRLPFSENIINLIWTVLYMNRTHIYIHAY